MERRLLTMYTKLLHESQASYKFKRDVCDLCTDTSDEVLINPKIFLNLVINECVSACQEIPEEYSGKLQVIAKSVVAKCISNIEEKFKDDNAR